MAMSIGMGVEFGSALVPEVVCCSIASINVAGFAFMVMPGMDCMGGEVDC